MFVTLGLGGLGLIDDYLKVSTSNNSRGVSVKTKLCAQFLVAFIACISIQKVSLPDYETRLAMPFFKHIILNLGHFYIVFAMLVIVGSSNSVNLTDGLDGLAAGSVTVATLCFSIICYLVGNSIFAHYLQMPYIPGSGELSVFCAALVGAGMGFLWYNSCRHKYSWAMLGVFRWAERLAQLA